MNLRIKDIYAKLKQEDLDGLIVSSPFNISYLTGFSSCDAYLIISQKGNIYITDSRYIAQVGKKLDGCMLKEIKDSVSATIAAACRKLGLKRIAFEERYLTFADYNKISKELFKIGQLRPTYGLVEDLRQCKSTQEIEKIRKAIQITVLALRFIQDFIRPGKKEVEVAGELERFIRYNGAYASSFDIIVASGANSSFPHHMTSQRRIENNEPVLIDLGVSYSGYKSDLTRVFFLGKMADKVKRVYEIVLKAQKRAISSIRPTIEANKVDYAARQYIKQKGFGGFFSHSLGHGVGLEIHEEPRISSKSQTHLKPGMVFTVEPAVYLPDKFGVRLEDMVLVTKEGVEILSDGFYK